MFGNPTLTTRTRRRLTGPRRAIPRFALIAILGAATLNVGCELFKRSPDEDSSKPNPVAEKPETDEIRCTVSLKPIEGEPEYRYIYQGKTYFFATEECLEKFKTDPEYFVHLANG